MSFTSVLQRKATTAKIGNTLLRIREILELSIRARRHAYLDYSIRGYGSSFGTKFTPFIDEVPEVTLNGMIEVHDLIAYRGKMIH